MAQDDKAGRTFLYPCVYASEEEKVNMIENGPCASGTRALDWAYPTGFHDYFAYWFIVDPELIREMP